MLLKHICFLISPNTRIQTVPIGTSSFLYLFSKWHHSIPISMEFLPKSLQSTI